MDYSDYSDILEYIPRKISCDINIKSDILYNNVLKFLNKHKLKKILISLSGGVDSMVLFDICHQIKLNDINDLIIKICHINYNNREESKLERDFLIFYCKNINYVLEYIDLNFKRGECKRDIYEKESRNLRYQFYSKLNKDYSLDGVFLAHHEDDLIENIFNNIMRGQRELTNLSVLKEKNNILNVLIYRPMLNVNKDIIYVYSNNYQIPYFLDSTPDWSCRGKMRRKIFPSCDDCYTNKYKDNLLRIGKESDELNIIINEYVLKDLIEKTIVINGNIKIKKEKIIQEKYILKNLLLKIAHKYQLNLKFKIIDSILDNYHKNIKLSMSKDYIVLINDNYICFNKY